MPPQNPTPVPVVNPPQRRKHIPGKWLTAAVVLVVMGVASMLLIQNEKKQTIKAEPTATVQITDAGFVPQIIHINAGESVTWVNTGSALHEVAADPEMEGFAAERSLTENQSITFSFDKKGTYTYHDPLNEKLKATVIVE